jgi:hypothetical protein
VQYCDETHPAQSTLAEIIPGSPSLIGIAAGLGGSQGATILNAMTCDRADDRFAVNMVGRVFPQHVGIPFRCLSTLAECGIAFRVVAAAQAREGRRGGN